MGEINLQIHTDFTECSRVVNVLASAALGEETNWNMFIEGIFFLHCMDLLGQVCF